MKRDKTSRGGARNKKALRAKPEKPNVKKKKIISYKSRLLINYSVLFCVVLAVGLVLSLTIFFKIEDIEVCGNTMYSYDDIISKSAIKRGNNLFLSSLSNGKKRIENELPYIEKIRLIRRLPNKVIIDVEDSKMYCSVENEGKYVIINREGKAIDIMDESIGSLIIKGIEINEVKVGESIEFKDKEKERNFNDLFSELKKWNIYYITKIDFADPANIMIGYKDCIDINLGVYENINYKIRTAQEIINAKLKEGERGTLNLSSVSYDNRSYFVSE